MFSLPVSIKKLRQYFPHKSMGVFLHVQEQITIAGGPIWPKFELLLDMHGLDTYSFKMDRINSNPERVATSIFRRTNSVVRGQIWPNSKLIQDLMYIIVTCKYENDPIKNS